jgi:hypothetical protein
MNETSTIRPATWEIPAEAATPKSLAAIGVAGLAGAIALPTRAAGVGFLVVAVVCAACTWWVMGRVRLASATWGVLSLALVAVTVTRDAGWLFLMCLIGACVAGSLAVAGGRSVSGLFSGALTVMVASALSIPWVARGLTVAGRRTTRRSIRVGQSVVVSVVLLAVFTPLLAGADAAFAQVVRNILPEFDIDSVVRWFGLFFVVGLGAAGAFMTVASPPHLAESAPPRRRLSTVEWGMPAGILVVLFTGFAAVQLAAFFGGSDYVLKTANLTYAEYARTGFWQLSAVTLLTLAVVAGVARWAATQTARDRVFLRSVLGALCLLMLVVVASALTRMWAYQQAYGFTVMRLLVEVCELWLGVVYLLVIAAGVRLSGGWLPRAIVGSALAGLLAFAWVNPERLVAAHNVTRWEATHKLDATYLGGLSADAAPELDRLPADVRPCGSYPPDTDWRDWNLSRRLQEEAPQQGCRSL